MDHRVLFILVPRPVQKLLWWSIRDTCISELRDVARQQARKFLASLNARASKSIVQQKRWQGEGKPPSPEWFRSSRTKLSPIFWGIKTDLTRVARPMESCWEICSHYIPSNHELHDDLSWWMKTEIMTLQLGTTLRCQENHVVNMSDVVPA